MDKILSINTVSAKPISTLGERGEALAADFLVKTGPSTPQERWEERPGYSPSTIAAEIAGLVCAAEIAKKNGDDASAKKYLATADDWQANIEKWTATTTGKYGDGRYYLRITANGRPDAGEKVELNNGAGTFDEREIVDAGFLELVRLGIKSPDDPLIAKSVKVIDQILKVDTPNGAGFYRYNHDGYGEMDDGRRWNWDGKYTGKGRLWALLSGERGQFELAIANYQMTNKSIASIVSRGELWADAKFHAIKRLDSMLGFANDGLMIPEQVWDKKETPKNVDRQYIPELKFGEGTGSATPLAWSMAQFIRLATNLKIGRNLDTPQVVYDRYVKKNSQMSAVSRQPGPASSLSQGEFDCLAQKASHKGERSSTIFPVIRKCKDGSYYAVLCFRGNAKQVQVTGDFTGWKPADSLSQDEPYAPPKQDYDTNKSLSIEFKPTARVEYKLIVDGKWITDPLNSNKIDNGVGGENSFFTMPDYKPTPWADWQGMTKSVISIDRIKSLTYGQSEIKVYVPDGFDKKPLPVMYLQDGSDYVNRAEAITVQRNLVKANKVKPFIMVFLDPKDRMKEYWANDDYARFLATEVVPAIDAKYNTIKSPDGRALLGASLGGVTSFWIGLKYPDKFARIGGQSSSFWIDDKRVVKELAKLSPSKTKFKIYIDDGTLEGVEDSQEVVKLLRDKGFDVTYIEGEAGHNWTAWRDRLADAFVDLWK